MSDLFLKLGVNWKLLLAQAVNFGLLLVILRFIVYKPLLAILRARRRKIEQGFKDADEAAVRLAEAEEVKRVKMREAEEASLALLKTAELKSQSLEVQMVASAHEKEAEIIGTARRRGEQAVEEEKKRFYGEAAALVREAIVKIAGTKRDMIDEHLVAQTIDELAKQKI